MYSSRETRSAPRVGTLAATLLLVAGLFVAGPAGAYEEINTFPQAETRDAAGKITVEASTVHVVNCTGPEENGGQFYIFEYVNRPGFRAILPPEWGKPIGGKDFSTYVEAVTAACSGPDIGDGGPDIGDGGPDIGEGVGPSYLGCFADKGERDLNRYLADLTTNSPEQCVQTCADQGYAYAGLQYGFQCYCGNVYGKYGAAENCDVPCPGDETQTCGGAWANDVWATGIRAGGGDVGAGDAGAGDAGAGDVGAGDAGGGDVGAGDVGAGDAGGGAPGA